MSSPPAKRVKLDEPEAVVIPDTKPEAASLDALKARYPCLTDSLNAPHMTESSVGISQYVDAALPAFSAIIKHRFTDFLVNEVNLAGKVIELKSIQRPPAEEVEPASVEEKPADSLTADGSLDVTTPDAIALLALLGEDKFTELKEFHAAGRPNKKSPTSTMSSNPIESKDSRTSLHKLIRSVYSSALSTTTRTLPDSEDQVIDITWMNAKSRENRKPTKPKGNQPPFIHFTLSKCNRETHEALGALADVLNMSIRELAVAGTKDKRAVTAQTVSLRRGWRTLEDVWKCIDWARHASGGRGRGRGRGRGDRGRGRGGRGGRGGSKDEGLGFYIGDFEYSEEPLKLGLLSGNRFIITLRDVVADSTETIDKAVKTVQEHGFINYYGMQRFGIAQIPTHVIGLLLLRSEWELACDTILSAPREGEQYSAREARRLWREDKDAEGALKVLPKGHVAERCLLESFKKQGRTDKLDYLGALRSIPKNLKMLFVHAYQSYTWNTVVSKRIELYGCKKPIVGDVVLVDKSASESEPAVDADGIEEEKEEELSDLDKLRRDAKLPAVHTLTEADLPNYTVFDVLMPLPGFVVKYPDGEPGKLYREMMVADGLDPDDMYRKQSEFSMGGTYRRIMHLPSNMSYKMLRYDDPNFPLTETDEDRMFKRTLPEPPAEGVHLALQLNMTLGSSTYATMALREILKAETGSEHQKGLTKAMLAKNEADGQDQMDEEIKDVVEDSKAMEED